MDVGDVGRLIFVEQKIKNLKRKRIKKKLYTLYLENNKCICYLQETKDEEEFG